jgi:hypothetical protein
LRSGKLVTTAELMGPVPRKTFVPYVADNVPVS